ncbi:MAG: hypothetical protein R3E32_08355 [Chitinophagales bacterium]
MKEILHKFSIDQFDDIIYEFAPLEINWWDSEHRTSIEVEIHRDAKDLFFLSIIFSPDIEGIVERTVVFFTSFHNKKILETTLVAKCVLENTQEKIDLGFSAEQNAYYTSSFSKSKALVNNILSIAKNCSPPQKFDLNSAETTVCTTEIGDTIDHFIAMMHINEKAFTKTNILDNIEQGIKFEGIEYVEDLKKDVDSGLLFNFEEQYEVSGETLNLVFEVIKNYSYNPKK